MISSEAAPPDLGLIARIIAASAARPFLTLILVGLMGLWGWFSLLNAPLDAIPDLSDTQVIVFTEWTGRSPDLVEQQITFPISSSLLAAPRVKFVRGQSFFGLSFVYVIFEDGTDMYWARSRVLEYLNTAQADLPEGIRPTLGPDATGVGWVFQYALVDRSGGHDLQQLRSLQDWNLRYALESVPGVAEVASIGGFVKEYQIQLDPVRLRAHGIAIGEIVKAVRESNQEVGGRTLELAGHEHMIRGRGYIRHIDDLRKIPLDVGTGGTPLLLRDVAQVSLGPAMRRGIAELDGEGEVVGGIVIMRYGENALRVIDAVKERLEEVKRGLPRGVELVITYDRSGLIRDAIRTWLPDREQGTSGLHRHTAPGHISISRPAAAQRRPRTQLSVRPRPRRAGPGDDLLATRAAGTRCRTISACAQAVAAIQHAHRRVTV